MNTTQAPKRSYSSLDITANTKYEHLDVDEKRKKTSLTLSTHQVSSMIMKSESDSDLSVASSIAPPLQRLTKPHQLCLDHFPELQDQLPCLCDTIIDKLGKNDIEVRYANLLFPGRSLPPVQAWFECIDPGWLPASNSDTSKSELSILAFPFSGMTLAPKINELNDKEKSQLFQHLDQRVGIDWARNNPTSIIIDYAASGDALVNTANIYDAWLTENNVNNHKIVALALESCMEYSYLDSEGPFEPLTEDDFELNDNVIFLNILLENDGLQLVQERIAYVLGDGCYKEYAPMIQLNPFTSKNSEMSSTQDTMKSYEEFKENVIKPLVEVHSMMHFKPEI